MKQETLKHINPQEELTLLRLAAALGQGSSSERAELCNSLQTCHRKCLKEPPGDICDKMHDLFENNRDTGRNMGGGWIMESIFISLLYYLYYTIIMILFAFI